MDPIKLMNAFVNESEEIIIDIIENNCTNKLQAFRWACDNNKAETVKYLLDTMPIENISQIAFPELYLEACRNDNVEILKGICDYIRFDDFEFEDTEHPFRICSTNDNLSSLKWLTTQYECEPILLGTSFLDACYNDNLEIVNYLLSFLRDHIELCEEAFKLSCKEGNLSCAQLLKMECPDISLESTFAMLANEIYNKTWNFNSDDNKTSDDNKNSVLVWLITSYNSSNIYFVNGTYQYVVLRRIMRAVFNVTSEHVIKAFYSVLDGKNDSLTKELIPQAIPKCDTKIIHLLFKYACEKNYLLAIKLIPSPDNFVV